MATVLLHTMGGTAALESSTPDTGSASWVKTLGPTFTCTGTTATSATPGSDSEYIYDVAAGTAASTAVWDFYLSNADSSSYQASFLRRQADGSGYLLSVNGAGTVVLYHAPSYTVLHTFTNTGPAARWTRISLAVNVSFDFTLSLWGSTDRSLLGTGGALVINAETYTDSGTRTAGAGRTGFQAKNAILGRANLTDSATGGGPAGPGTFFNPAMSRMRGNLQG